MYKKEVKINGKKYSYYYYNLRENGKVRNICLGSDKKLAEEKEKRLRNKEDFNLLDGAPKPVKKFEFRKISKGLLILLIIFACLGFFYLFNNITGLVVYNDNIVLDVNQYVSKDALVFLSVNLEEYNKNISEFGFELVNDSYYISSLEVDINSFELNLDDGSYTFIASLVDNGELVAIKSQDIVVSRDEEVIKEIIEENISEENITLQNVTLQEGNVTPKIEINIQESVELVEPIRINENVKWKKTVKLNQSQSNLTIEVPKEALNLSVKEIINNKSFEIGDEKLKVIENDVIKDIKETNLISGQAIYETKNKGLINKILEWFRGITGYAIVDKNITLGEENLSLVIESLLGKDEVVIEVEYETPGPVSSESILDNGKKVTVYSDIHYENILAYTTISEAPKNNIKLYRTTNGVRELTEIIKYEDSNNNGLIDEIEWIVPYLSNQTYEIIIENITGGIGEWVPVGLQKWQDANDKTKFTQVIGGAISNYQKDDGAWAAIENDWVVENDKIVSNKDILKVEVSKDGQATITLNWDGEVYTLKQKLVDLVLLNTKTKKASKINGVGNLNFENPIIEENIIRWKNVSEGVNVEIVKENGAVFYRLDYGPDFISKAVGEYDLKQNKKDISLGNVMEVELVNTDNMSFEGDTYERVLKKFDAIQGRGEYEFMISRQELEYEGGSLIHEIPAPIAQNWKRKNGKTYLTENVKMDKVKEIHEKNPNERISHNTVTVIGVASIEDTYIESGGSVNRNFGGAIFPILAENSARRILMRVLNIDDALGPGATISLVNCSVYHYASSKSRTISLYRVFKPWVEGDEDSVDNDDGDITWNDWASDASEWTTAGCDNADDAGSDNSGDGTGADRKATAESSQICGTVAAWYNFTITATLGQAWYDGTAVENGVIFIDGTDNPGYNWGIMGTEYTTDPTKRPYFTFTYDVTPTNTAPTSPTPEINSTNGLNTTSQDLNCYDTIIDPDGNNLNVTVKWYNNSIQHLLVDYNNSYANNSFFNAVLNKGNLTVGNSWNCSMRLFDGALYSDWVNSSSLTILNSVPNNPSPSLVSVDGTNTTSSDLNCSATITDPDGNSMNVTVKWFNKTVEHLTLYYNNSYANGTLFGALLNKGNLSVGDVWNCSMRLFDGTDYSSWVNSSSVTIAAGPQSTLFIGQPFTIQNIPNAGVYVNTESQYNYRDYTVAYANNTLYCNNLTTTIPVLSYDWYKNDISLGSNTSDLNSNNFSKGDLIFCQINGINSTNRFIIDTSQGDFRNGTFSTNGTVYQINSTIQSGNLTLNNATYGYFPSGNYTSQIFDLGNNANASEISFGYDVPKLSYYYPDNLTFYWDGSVNYSYINYSLQGTKLGGVVIGSANVNGTNKHLIDNNATEFDSINDYISFPYTAPANFSDTEGTFSAWIKTANSSGAWSQVDVLGFDSTVSNYLHLTTNTQRLKLGSFPCILGPPNKNYNDGNWHYVVLVINQTHYIIYGDTVYEGSQIKTSEGCKFDTPITKIYIGWRQAYFNGTIDEVAIWNRALSSGEISQLYNSSKYGNLKLQTKEFNYYNEGDEDLIFGWHGDSKKDYVGGIVGTENGGVKVNNKEGYLGGGTEFDGVDDYLNYGNSYDFSTTDFSVSAWVKTNTNSGSHSVVSKETAAGNEKGWFIRQSSTNFYWMVSNNSNIDNRFVGGSVEVGNWIHLVLRVNRNGNVTSYKNGVQVGTKDISLMNGDDIDISYPLNIGGISGFFYWNGSIDEVHIWKRALTSNEINLMYNNSVNAYNQNWSDEYYIANGSVNPIINLTSPYRYLQYRALFDTLDTNVTPVLTDVVIKQVDYKVRIFNTAPYGNFSLLYPVNNSLINNNRTTFNITNASDLDRDSLWFEILIYNSTNTSILYLQNKTYNNYSLSASEQLVDGIYFWKSKLFDNSTIYDTIYENRYSSWSNDFTFNLVTNVAPTNPTPEINSTNGLNTTSQDLNCYDTIIDPDGNNLNVTVKWYNNSIQHLIVDYNSSYANNSFFNAVLDKGNLTVGNSWNCSMRLFDGTDYSSWVNSSSLTILNAAPNNPSPLINSTSGTNLTSEDLHCSFTPTDNDAGETLFANITWLNNNITNLTFTSLSVTQDNLYVNTLKSANISVGQNWSCQAQVCDDSSSCSSWVNSSQILILSANNIPNNVTPLINSTLGTNLTSEDLWCSFTPSDPDTGETLFANISWLENNATRFTFKSLSVNNGSIYSNMLNRSNLTTNNLWSCQAQVCDDSSSCSSWVNSTQLRILMNYTLSNCTDINMAGNYQLIDNIPNSIKTYCMNITVSNVELDCQGYLIDGTDTASTYGIYSMGASGAANILTNVTIKNCIVNDWESGIYFLYTNNSVIDSVNSTSNSQNGILLRNSRSNKLTNITSSFNTNWGLYMFESAAGVGCNFNIIENNTFSGHTGTGYRGGIYTTGSSNKIRNNTINKNKYGIYITVDYEGSLFNNFSRNTIINNTIGVQISDDSSDNNFFWDNLFNNTQNYATLWSGADNRWNRTKTSGTNIITGAFIGGNYWGSPSGNNFSDTCINYDNDGICDNKYNITDNDLDYLPLTYNTNSVPNNATVLVNSTDGSNLTSVNLNVFFTPVDNDGDVSQCDIIWMKNNVTNLTFNSLSCSNNVLFVNVLNNSNLTVNDLWNAEVRVRDSNSYNSSWVNSSQLLIREGNAPVVNLDYPTNNLVLSSNNVTFNFTVTDESSIDSCKLWGNWSSGGGGGGGATTLDFTDTETHSAYWNGSSRPCVGSAFESNYLNSNPTTVFNGLAKREIVTSSNGNYSNIASENGVTGYYGGCAGGPVGRNTGFLLMNFTLSSSNVVQLKPQATLKETETAITVRFRIWNNTAWELIGSTTSSTLVNVTKAYTALLSSYIDSNKQVWLAISEDSPAYDVDIDYVKLDVNYSSSSAWHLNQTIRSITKGQTTNFSQVTINDGSYIWNVWCNDTFGNNAFNATNFTFTTTSNTAPNAPSSLVINSTNTAHTNYTNEDLAMNFLCEDPDASDVLTYHLMTYKEGVAQFMLESSCNDPEYKRVLLDNANTTKYDNWSFSVNVSDDSGVFSSTVSSVVNLTIKNSPPSQVTLNDPPSGNMTTDRTPTLKWNQAIDLDSDILTYDVFIKCLPSCSIDNRVITGQSGSCGAGVCSYTLTTELNYFWDDNYFYNWSIRGYDAANYGANSTEWNISIQSEVILSLPNLTVAFESKSIGEKDNTSDGQPGPFLIQNDGNSIIDVNISALTWLWSTKQSASSFFQYKVDNYTSEPNSFDYSSSTTTWTDIPNTNNSFVRWLNYSDSNDVVETDILIEVPLNEPSGDKESLLSFTGYYVKIT